MMEIDLGHLDFLIISSKNKQTNKNMQGVSKKNGVVGLFVCSCSKQMGGTAWPGLRVLLL